jgi:hypothetical protein
MRLDMVIKMSNVFKEANDGLLNLINIFLGIMQIGLIINLFAMFYYWCLYSIVRPFLALILMGVIFVLVYKRVPEAGVVAEMMWSITLILYFFLWIVFIIGEIVSLIRFNSKEKREIKHETYNKLLIFHHAISSVNVWALFVWPPFTFMCLAPVDAVIWYVALLYGLLGGSALGAGSMVNLVDKYSYLKSTLIESKEIVKSTK